MRLKWAEPAKIIAENQITRELLNRHKFEFTEPCVSGERRGGGYA